MDNFYKIGFAGTDARTLLSALVVSTAKSHGANDQFRGVVIRGTSSMPAFAGPEYMNWPVDFIPTVDNSCQSYAQSIIQALEHHKLDYVLPLPEALLFEGIVDQLSNVGYQSHIIGLSQEGTFIEADKIKCKHLCQEAGIPVADAWSVVDAKSSTEVFQTCLDYLHTFGGAVLKYPYSAGGKGARIIGNTWEIKDVYDTLMQDYKKTYKHIFHHREWPLLIESRMSGVEISFTIFVDSKGNYQILPTSMDYPERYAGPASTKNPVTGGMGCISPHPFESPELFQLVERDVAKPIIQEMKRLNILRPCVLYPGCFVSFELNESHQLTPRAIRISEINIRPGEPEFQAVIRRTANLGALVKAMCTGELDQVSPEIRQDQLALCIALVTGPGGPDGQKGYPWSVTKYEPVAMDCNYLQKKNIQMIPSGMGYSADKGFFSDGTRVAYLNTNGTVHPQQARGEVAKRLRNKLINAYQSNKIRVIPREDPEGNRLAIREDIGLHYLVAEALQDMSHN
jgi:phosphoribosylamine--glycine ligase